MRACNVVDGQLCTNNDDHQYSFSLLSCTSARPRNPAWPTSAHPRPEPEVRSDAKSEWIGDWEDREHALNGPNYHLLAARRCRHVDFPGSVLKQRWLHGGLPSNHRSRRTNVGELIGFRLFDPCVAPHLQTRKSHWLRQSSRLRRLRGPPSIDPGPLDAGVAHILLEVEGFFLSWTIAFQRNRPCIARETGHSRFPPRV